MNPITKEDYAQNYHRFHYGPLQQILERLRAHNMSDTHTIIDEDSFGYWVNWNKSKNYTKSTDYCRNDFTLLRECEHCGKVSTPKKIQTRYLCGLRYEISKPSERWRGDYKRMLPMLCMSCYNKARPYSDKLVENEELRLQVGRLQREIYKQNKKVNK